jgi:carbonic anhydrase/acetyltransferase-like protein (isoleucine patch superfamily)
MSIFELASQKPRIHPTAYIAPTATVVGKVTIGADASIWFNCVVRGDSDGITIGRETNIQDLSVLHVHAGKPLVIGDRVTVGHRCIVHGCTIEDDCLIGMGAIIMNGVKIGRGSIVAAGAVVLEDTVIPPFSLVAGVPGAIKRSFGDRLPEIIPRAANIYVERARSYRTANVLKAVG